MAPVVGMVGAAQALEAIKVIAQFGQLKQGKLLISMPCRTAGVK